MKQVSLTKGKIAFVDDADFPLVANQKWCASKGGNGLWYALQSHWRKPRLRMHQVIMGIGIRVDHKNRNGLDNRRRNLRPATRSQNQANRGRQRNNKSGFKGVSWDKQKGKWRAVITIGRKQIFVGRFSARKSAANAYNNMARRLFGAFAYLNPL